MGSSIRRYGVWVVVALVGAVCWGVLALSRGETINAGWLLFAAIASYAIAYRFYARFIQKKVLETDDSRATPAERLNNGRDFEPMDRRVLFGHHFAAIRGGGATRGARARGPDGVLAGDGLDHRRRYPRGRRAGHDDAVLLHAAQREDPGSDGQGRDRPRGRRSRAHRGPLHHGHPARRACPGRGPRAGRVALGVVLDSHDPTDSAPDGRLSALYPARPGAGGLDHRGWAPVPGDHRGRLDRGVQPLRRLLDVQPEPDSLRAHRLRLYSERPAGLGASGAPGLPLDVHEDRDDHAPRDRDHVHPARDPDAQGHPVCL